MLVGMRCGAFPEIPFEPVLIDRLGRLQMTHSRDLPASALRKI
jgi:hypothetical protein